MAINRKKVGFATVAPTYTISPSSTLFYPKQGKNEFYKRLLKQCSNLGIPEVGAGEASEAAFEKELERTDVVMDAIFGFSFEGEPRPPFDVVIQALKKTKKPTLSVDIPSAWNVEKGDPEGKYFTPGMSKGSDESGMS